MVCHVQGAAGMSHALRVRGLKPEKSQQGKLFYSVARSTRAWIETTSSGFN